MAWRLWVPDLASVLSFLLGNDLKQAARSRGMLAAMEDTRASRDLPVLDAVVSALEDDYRVSAAQIAEVTGISGEEVVRAFYALQSEYVGSLTVNEYGDRCRQVLDRPGDRGRPARSWPVAHRGAPDRQARRRTRAGR